MSKNDKYDEEEERARMKKHERETGAVKTYRDSQKKTQMVK